MPRCKHLVNTYLLTIIKEDQAEERKASRSKMPVGVRLSNRKLKRIKYTKFQRLYTKNRKKAYDSLFNNASVDYNLAVDDVFSFWRHLLTHVAINEPNPNQILFEETPVTFCEELLIYPNEVAKYEPRGKSAAALMVCPFSILKRSTAVLRRSSVFSCCCTGCQRT